MKMGALKSKMRTGSKVKVANGPKVSDDVWNILQGVDTDDDLS